MCQDCYNKYADRYTPVTQAILTAAAAVDDLYEESSVGGAMHIVTDDFNLGDESLAFCRTCIETQTEQACYDALRVLTENERATALAIHRGYMIVA